MNQKKAERDTFGRRAEHLSIPQAPGIANAEPTGVIR